MTNSDGNRQLSIEQQNAIDLLITGMTDEEVATQVGVTRQTVNQWRNQNPLFAAELNRRREEAWGSSVDGLRHLQARAVEVLKENLANKDARLRQQAAVQVLKASGLYGTCLEPKGETEPEDVEAAWRCEAEMNRLKRSLGVL